MRPIIYNEEIHIYYAMEILNNYLDKHYTTQDKKIKAKMHNHPLGFDSVANRPPGVLILQYNHLRFLNW